jgi:FKBP-type peptidyl-prolyl cis-trans isomerase FkpA
MQRVSRWAGLASVVVLAAGCPQQDKDQKAAAGGGTSAMSADGGTPTAPATEEQKTLYALGLSVGRQVSQFDLSKEELEYVKAGMEAQVTGATPAVEIQTYGPKLSEMARTRSTARAAKEKEKSKEFLEKARQEQGATTTPSGIVIKTLNEGNGPMPTEADTVKVHYKGTLTNGKEFDSSYSRNEPTTFPLGGVVPCWREALQKMKVGGKARIVCPSDLAYGDRGAGPNIPGGAALIFEVELVEILPPQQQQQPGMPGMPPPPGQPTMRPGQQPPSRPGQPPPPRPGQKPGAQ